MVSDPHVTFPDPDAVASRVRAATRADAGCVIDARSLAERLCGGDQYANVLLLGAAYQVGALPLTLDALQQAIRLNGVAVEKNLHAFSIGREAALGRTSARQPSAAPRPVARRAERAAQAAMATAALVHAEPGGELSRIVADRSAELTDYQSAAYARTYAELVEQVRSAEATLAPTGSDSAREALAEAVARNLYKLMAYKDEYEVARLALDPVFSSEIERQFGADARFAWRLHPPLLRALGMQRKISLGSWATPLMLALRAGRRLRGTPLNLFGRTEVRRTERQLVAEYRDVLSELVAHLTPETHAAAVEIAGLPDMVRGYEEIKLANVERYHQRLAERRSAYLGDQAS